MDRLEKTLFVYDNWRSEDPTLFGRLNASLIKGQEIFSFEYSDKWLSTFHKSFALDPDLSFFKGRQYLPSDKKRFGLFMDSCPDRWGRLLLSRKEAMEARKENRKPRKLMESDYLLGVHDRTRMGALRFRLAEDGPFLSSDDNLSTPPWIRLRTLESASLAFESDDGAHEEQWLNVLLAPGSSLGGARPKASVLAEDGSLWIAKFPSRHDENNSGAWEKVVQDLARLCTLNVPESRLETFSTYGSTFLIKRFDRNGSRRIHFASAMTLLGKTDGASASDGTSYLELAAFLRANGAEPKQDLMELWKRIVFNMAVSNTDDHLRNHGFLLTSTGWRISPLYDVNPVPSGDRLALNVDEYDNRIDLALALEVAEFFGISQGEARALSNDIQGTVEKNWVGIAKGHGLSRGPIESMRPAFSLWAS